jgi:hypothetical protein
VFFGTLSEEPEFCPEKAEIPEFRPVEPFKPLYICFRNRFERFLLSEGRGNLWPAWEAAIYFRDRRSYFPKM